MSQKRYCSISLFTAAFFFCFGAAIAQTPKAFFWEAEFDVELPQQGNWEFSFGAANRYLFFSEVDGNRVNEDDQQHIEINHFTQYKTSPNAAFSLGFRYRFRETFEKNRHDEFRIIEQFNYTHRGSFLEPAHRLRFEQRFREMTIYRLRYRLGISQPLSKDFELVLSTEFLYSMVKNIRPEAEQRFSLELENSSFENLELSLGFDLRREDFTGFPGTEYYLLTGASLQL